MKKNNITRWLLFASALLLPLTLLFPLWKIELTAPQYPEGLVMKIWLYKLSGDVDVINGLNHYIGMNTIHENDFPEFKIFPYLVIILALGGLLAAWFNKKKGALAYTLIFMLFGIVAIADFWHWEYTYGHNLDPSAPIQVPGMSYQPPLIGYKQLLNFGAFAIPDTAGWIFFLSIALALAACFLFIRQSAKLKNVSGMATAVLLVFIISACSKGPQPVLWGKQSCEFCKMTLMDHRYGAQILNRYGKAIQFDDIICLSGYLDAGNIAKENIRCIYFVDFKTSDLLPADKTIIVKSEQLRSPMSSHLAAVAADNIPEEIKAEKQFRFDELFSGIMLKCD
jgi:copper chaperone NosL